MPPKKEKDPKEGKEAKEKKEEDKGDKISPPDKNAYNKDIADKNEQIKKLTQAKGEIDKKLQAKTSDKDGYYEKKALLASKMKTYGEQIQQLNEQKKELRAQFSGKVDDKKKLTKHRLEAEKGITYRTEAELQARIDELQFEMCTSSLPLAVEKKKVAEIQQLKKQKPQINAQAEKLEGLKAKEQEMQESTVFTNIKEQIDNVTAKCEVVWKAKELVKAEYSKLVDEQKKDTETSELETQRKDLQTKINDFIRERNDLRKKMQDEEQAYTKYMAEQRRIQQEKRAEEGKKRREENEKRDFQRKQDELMVQPYLAEVALLEQTITFCKNLLPKEKDEERENIQPSFNNPEGSVVLIKKQDRDEEFYMPVSKKKGPHKKNKAPSSNVIKHDAYTFRLFDALKISAPSTTDQIPSTLEQLQKELARYNAEIAVWEKKRDDGTLLEEFQQKAKEKMEQKQQQAEKTQDEVAATEE